MVAVTGSGGDGDGLVVAGNWVRSEVTVTGRGWKMIFKISVVTIHLL